MVGTVSPARALHVQTGRASEAAGRNTGRGRHAAAAVFGVAIEISKRYILASRGRGAADRSAAPRRGGRGGLANLERINAELLGGTRHGEALEHATPQQRAARVELGREPRNLVVLVAREVARACREGVNVCQDRGKRLNRCE